MRQKIKDSRKEDDEEIVSSAESVGEDTKKDNGVITVEDDPFFEKNETIEEIRLKQTKQLIKQLGQE